MTLKKKDNSPVAYSPRVKKYGDYPSVPGVQVERWWLKIKAAAESTDGWCSVQRLAMF